MTNVNWTNNVAPSVCKSPWQSQHKASLGRVQYDNIKLAYDLNYSNSVELKFGQYLVSLQHIDQRLAACKNLNVQYVFLIVNKFLIYTELDGDEMQQTDLDLVNHWSKVLDWPIVYASFVSNDRGLIGNFDFPATQILFQRCD